MAWRRGLGASHHLHPLAPAPLPPLSRRRVGIDGRRQGHVNTTLKKCPEAYARFIAGLCVTYPCSSLMSYEFAKKARTWLAREEALDGGARIDALRTRTQWRSDFPSLHALVKAAGWTTIMPSEWVELVHNLADRAFASTRAKVRTCAIACRLPHTLAT